MEARHELVLGTIAVLTAEGYHRPALPRGESRTEDHLVLTATGGSRWRGADVRQGERPRVHRCPPDAEATHRVFWRLSEGPLAVCDLAVTRPALAYHGVADDADSALSVALEHALDRTHNARERLAG
jgi:hypothetical protein